MGLAIDRGRGIRYDTKNGTNLPSPLSERITVMAKKGGPQKECPKCKAKVHARTRKCKCGHVFTFKVKEPKTKELFGAKIDLHKALPIIDKMGGVKGLKSAVDAYHKAQDALKEVGGVDSAVDLLEEIETLRAVLGK